MARGALVVALLLCCGSLFAAEENTVLLSDLDIPLMPGFIEDEGSRVVFDTPEGRIIETRATGPDSANAVLDYYRLVLPSLAWAEITEQGGAKSACNNAVALCLLAERDEEILIVKIKTLNAETTIYFSVNPK